MQFSNINLKPSGIRKLFDYAKQLEKTKTIHHLEIGQPYFNPPEFILAAAKNSVSGDAFRYIENRGDLISRQTVCEWVNTRIPTKLDPIENIVFTAGCSEGLVSIYGALLSPGDAVMVPTPAWPHYKEVAKLFSSHAIEIPLTDETGFRLDINLLEQYWTPRCKILIFNNPNNPTGVCYSLDFQRELLAWAKQKNIILLFDEIYDTYHYNGQFESALLLPETLNDAVYLNGFSKSLGVPGLRVGYILGAPELCAEINKVHQYLTVCAPSLSLQIVSLALRSPDLEHFFKTNKEQHQLRFSYVKESLAKIPQLKLSKASGAFYFFVSYPPRYGNSNEVSLALLSQYGVAVSPGNAFGDEYEHHFRLCYSTELATLHAALDYITQFFG